MKIGFVSNIYGTPKGHSYVVRDMVNAVMDDGHEAHMYRIRNNVISSEFKQPTTLTTEQSAIIPKDKFEKWLDEINPDWCIFMEYAQWWDENHDKVKICKERGIKTVGWLVYEKLNWNKKDHYKLYTKILCPTGFQTKLCRKYGLYNAVHIPWGVDMKEIDVIPQLKKEENDPIRFFHCAGSGGVGDRKNTKAVIDAYKLIKDENTKLNITHLGCKVFSRNEIIAFTKYSDVVLNPAKWDTIGLNTMEANMCGKPVIVANTNPMTELIKNNVNGFTVDGAETTFEQVTCPSYEVNVEDLAKKMAICKNKLILNTLQNNSRKFAETNFDWNKNKIHFLKIFERGK